MRTVLTQASLVLVLLLGLVACKNGKGGGTADVRIQSITNFNLADWELITTDGAERPSSDNGRLRLESNVTTARSSAAIRSRVRGRFADFSTDLTMARLSSIASPADYEAFLEVGVNARTEPLSGTGAAEIATLARLGLTANDNGVSIVAQLLDASGNPVEQRVVGLAGFQQSVPLRIVVDLEREVVRFFAFGAVVYTYVPTTLTLPADSAVGVRASGRGFLVFGDRFQVLDSKSTQPSFSLRLTRDGISAESPGRVQALFTLRDQAGEVLSLPDSQLNGDRLTWRENEVAVDRVESNPLLKRASLPQDVVVVLDFTASLDAIGGIPEMLSGAKDLAAQVWESNADNRVQFWEHHDDLSAPTPILSNKGTNWLRPADQTAAEQALDQFAATVYHGFSRVFDAVDEAAFFSFLDDPRDAVRSVVFLTDGIDTSSFLSVDDLIADALDDGYTLNPIAIATPPVQERWLRRIAAETDGTLVPVADVAFLATQFRELAGDLDSLYSASYISGRSQSGSTTVDLNLSLLLSGASQPVSLPTPVATTLFIPTGDTLTGTLDLRTIAFSDSPDSPNTAVVRAKALFVPRDATSFKIGDFSGMPAGATVDVRKVDGGLLDAWTQFGDVGGGLGRASGPELGFGEFGEFLELEISNIPATTASFTLFGRIVNDELFPVQFRTTQGAFDGDFFFSVFVSQGFAQ